VRTWTSKSGQRINAKGITLTGSYLLLEKDDGSKARINIRRLIKEDQDYANHHFQKKTPARITRTLQARNVELPWPSGEITEEIKTERDPQWSYHVYLPKSFHMNKKWPVMFVMGPGGGSKGKLRRYVKGAEENNWILAMSIQSRNGFEGSRKAMIAMVDDVSNRLPADSRRFYSSGFSGGARMAFVVAEHLKKKRFAGVLACGAGGRPDELSSKTAVYGLCGSNCFNRWDMACTLKGLKNKDSRLKYFPGNHSWASADLIADGISWLNGSFLRNAAGTDKHLAAERDEYAKRLLTRIEERIESDPAWAYEWALFLSQFTASSTVQQEATTHLRSLEKQSKIQLHAKAMTDMERFIKKHFATSPMDYINNNGSKKTKRAADKLAQIYKDTILFETFQRMGEPSVKP